MSLLRLQDKRLLLTFTVRDLKPPLGVRALVGAETDDGFEFDFAHDRLMLDVRTPIGKYQGGGFGPSVQLDDGTLVTSYVFALVAVDAGIRSTRPDVFADNRVRFWILRNNIGQMSERATPKSQLTQDCES